MLSVGVMAEDSCWICLQGIEHHTDCNVFRCCMPCHHTCLLKWQLRRIGHEDECVCRVCKMELPAWLPLIRDSGKMVDKLSIKVTGRAGTHLLHVPTFVDDPAKHLWRLFRELNMDSPCTLSISASYGGKHDVNYNVPMLNSELLNKVIWAVAHTRFVSGHC